MLEDGSKSRIFGGILALNGEDVRKLPLGLRKTNLARLLARRPEGIFVSDFEQGEIGPDLFVLPARWAWKAWYRSAAVDLIGPGRSPDWIKEKTRKHPAMERVMDSFR